MMKKKILLILVLFALVLFVQSASAVVIDYEDQNFGDTFLVGDSFMASGLQINVLEFEPVGSTPTSGHAEIQADGDAGSFGNEVWLDNVNLEFNTNLGGCPSCGISLLFGWYGGDINLGINGEMHSATDFSGLPSTINGAAIHLVQPSELGLLLVISGGIDTFTIGGQELALDTMLVCETPEPATITMLGMGFMGLMMKKKRH